MVFRLVIFSMIFGLTYIVSSVVSAEENPVVANVNGFEIRFYQVQAAQKRLPKEFQQVPIEQIFPRLVDSLIDTYLAAASARIDKLHETKEFNTQMNWIKEQVLQRLILGKITEKAINEVDLSTLYEKEKRKLIASEQIQASHILLKTEEEAKEVITLLLKGNNFAKLAKKRSTGPSANDGGNLGFFGRGQMVPEFEKAAYELKPEEYTKKPVKTQFGWHVIKAGVRKSAEVPSFELMKPKLRNIMFQKTIADFIRDLRKSAKIELFNLDGTSSKQVEN
jgi:peptidyl-prolyl cis-trans isomerase C